MPIDNIRSGWSAVAKNIFVDVQRDNGPAAPWLDRWPIGLSMGPGRGPPWRRDDLGRMTAPIKRRYHRYRESTNKKPAGDDPAGFGWAQRYLVSEAAVTKAGRMSFGTAFILSSAFCTSGRITMYLSIIALARA